MPTLRKTSDYSIFKKHENNRKIDKNNLNRLMFSISQQNMLEFRPILVDKDMRVIDGQHRLEAARLLGLEVYYQMNEESTHEDIVLLNAYQKQWKTEDYIEYWISRGNEHYARLKAYAERRNMGVPDLLAIVKDETGKKPEALKRGNFVFFDAPTLERINHVLDEVDRITDCLRRYVLDFDKVLGSGRIRRALYYMVVNPKVDVEVFIKKLTLKAESVRVCTTYSAYCIMFREIYNWKNHNPIS